MVDVLASSSSGNAVLVTDGDRRLLFDAGLPFPALQAALDYRVTSLDGVLITHEHQDHAKAIPGLLKHGVSVYATGGTIDALKLPRHHRLYVIAPLLPFVVRGWNVVAFPTKHDAAEPVGFIAAGSRVKAAYLTDTAFSEYRFHGVTHVMIEANYSQEILDRRLASGDLPEAQWQRVVLNHLSVERAIDLLLASDLRRCVEITLLHMSDGNSHAEDFRSQVERATGVPTRVARK